jgi:hypothetical protein
MKSKKWYSHIISNIVYRINKYHEQKDLFNNRKRTAKTWAQACEFAANKVNYRKIKTNKITNPWDICVRQAKYDIEKDYYTSLNQWVPIEYQILYWMNIDWKKNKRENTCGPFSVRASREVERINSFSMSKVGSNRIHDSWSLSIQRSRHNFNDINSGKNKQVTKSEFHYTFLATKKSIEQVSKDIWTARFFKE